LLLCVCLVRAKNVIWRSIAGSQISSHTKRFESSLRRRRLGWLDQPALSPELARGVEGIDASCLPPAPLVADPVQGAVVRPAERHHELVADLAAERPRLGEAQSTADSLNH
jgi:hypothetical protein